jgi:hypothetical protein
LAWFIPANADQAHRPDSRKLVTQTEDVLVDTRGNMCVPDKQWGLFVLRYTGKGESAPTAH